MNPEATNPDLTLEQSHVNPAKQRLAGETGFRFPENPKKGDYDQWEFLELWNRCTKPKSGNFEEPRIIFPENKSDIDHAWKEYREAQAIPFNEIYNLKLKEVKVIMTEERQKWIYDTYDGGIKINRSFTMNKYLLVADESGKEVTLRHNDFERFYDEVSPYVGKEIQLRLLKLGKERKLEVVGKDEGFPDQKLGTFDTDD